MTAVVDIDGVVADVRHRLQHVTGRPKDWGAFFEAAGDDPLLPEGERTVHSLAEVYDIVYLSGRPEWLRGVTQRWLPSTTSPRARCMLRPYDDYRPSRLYKVDVLRQLSRVAHGRRTRRRRPARPRRRPARRVRRPPGDLDG